MRQKQKEAAELASKPRRQRAKVDKKKDDKRKKKEKKEREKQKKLKEQQNKPFIPPRDKRRKRVAAGDVVS